MEESKTIARPYAKAVFDIALANKQLKEWSMFLQGCSHVVDNSEIMFMMMDDKEVHPSYDLGIWVNTPYFAGAMEDLLNNSWNNSS